MRRVTAFGVPYIDRDALNVEALQVPLVALRLDERDHVGTAREEGSYHGRADEPGCPRDRRRDRLWPGRAERRSVRLRGTPGS